jgi:hypothetical protein
MHTLSVEFDRMRKRNLVPRQKLRVAVTRSACVRQILFRYPRRFVARGLNLVHFPVAGKTIRRIGIFACGSLSVDAFPEFLYFVNMALLALYRRHLSGWHYLMVIAVTGLAAYIDRAVNAGLGVRILVGMTSCALHFRDFCWMRILFDGGMAVGTAENPVDAGAVLGGIDGQALPAIRLHSRLAVTGQAAFILLERMRRLLLCLDRLGRRRGERLQGDQQKEN